MGQSSFAPQLPVDPPQPAPATKAAPETAADGRDSRGRFTKGNKGGPGNPFARRVAALRQALLDTVTEEDIRVVSPKLIEQARAGDLAAAKLLFAYALGKPTDCVDPDTLDAQEWELFQQAPVTAEGLQTVLGGLPTPLACAIARNALPTIETQLAAQIGQALQPTPGPAAPTVPVSTNPAEAEKSEPPIGKPNRPRSAEKRAPVESQPGLCPTCLGFIPGPCRSCGRNTHAPGRPNGRR